MISFAEFDLITRGGTVALLGMWSWLLWRDHSHALAARVAIATNFAIACHVVGTAGPPTSGASILDHVVDVGASAVVGLFWLFAKTWFDDARSINWRDWVMFATPPFTVLIIHISGWERHEFVATVWFPFMRAIWFAFAIAGLWIVWRSRADDLVEARRKLRNRLLLVVGGLCVLINAVEIAVLAFDAPMALRSYGEFGILIAAAILCASMFGLRQADLFGAAGKPAPNPSLPNEELDHLKQRLLSHMQDQLPHRDETLTIAALAAQLGEQEYRLRRFINGSLGYRNFAQFLNSYRLAEVKAALCDPSQKDVPILTIALDAGFGSLGPFNRAFREAEGMTPSAYRLKA
jgi:AraC-like DNA-binding protein